MNNRKKKRQIMSNFKHSLVKCMYNIFSFSIDDECFFFFQTANMNTEETDILHSLKSEHFTV